LSEPSDPSDTPLAHTTSFDISPLPQQRAPGGRSMLGELWLFVRDVIVIIAVVSLIRTFIASPFQINGISMRDSYFDREFILVDRFWYRWQSPARGDVVVFYPQSAPQHEYLIKRIVGLP
jgi:signal peptidase I